MRWAQITLILAALASLWYVLALLDCVMVAGRVLAQETVPQSDITDAVNALNSAPTLLGLAVIPTGIAFVAWLSRTVDNTPPLGGGMPHQSPRWSFVWWFIPIAFLWKPYGIVREAWDRLATPARHRSGNLVLAWWFAALVGLLLNRISGSFPNTDQLASYRDALVWNIAGMCLLTVSAVLAVAMVREIQNRANERASFAQLEAPEGRWPAGAMPPGGPPAPPAPSPTPAAPWAAPVSAPGPAAAPVSSGPALGAPPPTDTVATATALAFCPHCGEKALPQARYCGRCGFDLSVSA